MSCGIKGCLTEPFFKCEECQPGLLLCKLHSRDHKYSLPLHNLAGLCIKVEANKDLHILSIESLLKNVDLTIRSVLSDLNIFTKKLTGKAKDIVFDLREIQAAYNDVIDRLMRSEELYDTANLNKSEKFIMKMIESDKIMKLEVSCILSKRNFMDSLILEFNCSKQLTDELSNIKNNI